MKYYEKKFVHYIPTTWSTPKKNCPLYSDYIKYFKKIGHYIPITWSTWNFFSKYFM